MNAVKEFATQFQEGIKGAQDVAGHVKQVSSILQLITSNSTLQSAAAAVYTVAAGVEENLGKVSSGLSTVLKPFNIVKSVVDVGKDINDKVLTPLTTTQFSPEKLDQLDEYGVLDSYRVPNAVGQFGQAANGLADILDNAAMNKVNGVLKPVKTLEQAIDKVTGK